MKIFNLFKRTPKGWQRGPGGVLTAKVSDRLELRATPPDKAS